MKSIGRLISKLLADKVKQLKTIEMNSFGFAKDTDKIDQVNRTVS